MALMNKPDEKIFASEAKEREVETFPDHTRGWGVSFEQTEGIPPMEWFNALFKRLDENIMYVLQRGLPEWSATVDYPKGAYVQHDGLSYKSLKETKGKQPNEANSQHWVRWGLLASDLVKATLMQFGITQLFTGYDSDREDLALTPKTAKMLKAFIDSNTRSLGNYIPNSKKSNSVDSPSDDNVATSSAVKAANDNANGRVSKWGDFIKWLKIENEQARLDLRSIHKEVAGVDYTVWDGRHPQASITAVDIGSFSVEQRFFTTPPGDNYNADRRQLAMTLGCEGHIWTKAYGWLQDFFLDRATYNAFRDKFSYAQYSGTFSQSRVFRIPITANTGIKFYLTQLTIGAHQSGHRFRLAEAMRGFRVGVASDTGGARLSYGVWFEDDAVVAVYCQPLEHSQIVYLTLIGEYQY